MWLPPLPNSLRQYPRGISRPQVVSGRREGQGVAGDWGAWPGTCSRRGAGRFRVGSQRRRPGVPGKCAGIVGPGRWSTKARGVWWGHRGGHITQCSFRAPTRPWSSVVLSSLWPRGHDARAACTRLFAMSRLVGAPLFSTSREDGMGLGVGFCGRQSPWPPTSTGLFQ